MHSPYHRQGLHAMPPKHPSMAPTQPAFLLAPPPAGPSMASTTAPGLMRQRWSCSRACWTHAASSGGQLCSCRGGGRDAESQVVVDTVWSLASQVNNS